MNRRKAFIAAAILGIAALGAGTAYAFVYQGEDAAALRATGQVGEQADGYLGLVGQAPGDVRSKVDAINIQRRARYTQLAQSRGVTIEEAAVAVACQIFASRVGPGQYYRLPDGVWRKRDGNTPVPRPTYCG